jgi:transposase-like protein
VTVGAPSYKEFRFPAEIISHCVWLYHRFSLSFREIEEMMLQRGITVSHETVRQWCAKFGQTYANSLRRHRASPGDTWHVDEVFIKICGKTHYLWRAVDQQGTVLDILVTSRRDTRAATRFFRKLLKGLECVPRVLITDKLASYGAARRRVLRSVEHRQSKYLTNRGRKFASADPGAGTSDEEVHLSQACPAFPVRLQRHLPTLPARPPPTLRHRLPPRDDRPIHHLEPDHRHGHSGLTRVVGTSRPIKPCP